MTDIPVELCHCGQVLHYTDPVAKDFTLQMIESLGPTVRSRCRWTVSPGSGRSSATTSPCTG